MLQNLKGIFISQKKYAKEVLERFGMEHCTYPLKNLIILGFKLVKGDRGISVYSIMCKQMVSNLMYLTATKSNLMFVLSLINRFMKRPIMLHRQAVKRIFKY